MVVGVVWNRPVQPHSAPSPASNLGESDPQRERFLGPNTKHQRLICSPVRTVNSSWAPRTVPGGPEPERGPAANPPGVANPGPPATAATWNSGASAPAPSAAGSSTPA
jgi:hypothetical protein